MLVFCDSFDDRDIAHVGDRYDSYALNTGAGAAIGAGRTGSGLILTTGILDVFDFVQKQFSARQTIYVGVARNAHSTTALCSIRYNGIPQIYAQLNDDGTVSVIRFDDGTPETTLATSSRTVPSGYYYVELMGKIDPLVGAYELRIDGETWLSANNVNTSSTGDSLANQVRLTHNRFGVDGAMTRVDDFYIADDDADGGDALIVGFAGPVHIACLLPNGEGSVNEWSPTGAATNHEAVGEMDGEDGDTSYVGSHTDGALDLYTLPNLEFGRAAIKAVAVHQWARRDDALYRALVPTVRTGGADYAADESALSNAYARIQTIYERNPATALAWTVAQVNAMQMGAEAVADA
jgi:hypothetical protein